MASTVLVPISKDTVGEPLVKFKFTVSLKTTLMLAVSLAFKVLFCAPVALVMATLLMLGFKVSRLKLGVVPVPPLLPAESW